MVRMSLSKSNTERLAQQRLEICGIILYILLVAWKRERLSLKVANAISATEVSGVWDIAVAS